MARSRMPVKPCNVEGCTEPSRARGLCKKHHKRLMRHGAPEGGRSAPGEPLAWLLEHASYVGADCLAWPFTEGMGNVWIDGKAEKASRAMCALAHGEPPTPEYEAAHSCGKGHEGCVNPSHLRWATTSENQMDRVLHGTSNRGERNARAVLTADDVRAIRLRLAAGEMGKDLAASYSVSPMTISSIKTGRLWSWLTA